MSFRRLQLVAVVLSAPLLLVVSVAAARHTPGYSGWRDTVSRLGSTGQPWAVAVRASFVAYGLLVAIGVQVLVRGSRGASLAAAALYTFAVASVVAGLAPKDLPGAPHTAASDVHVYATVVGGVALLLGMAIIGWSETSSLRRTITALAAVVIICATVVFRLTWGTHYYGAVERVVLAPGMAWLVLAAVWAWPVSLGDPDVQPAAPRN